jgi:hypothetical protein
MSATDSTSDAERPELLGKAEPAELLKALARLLARQAAAEALRSSTSTRETEFPQ